VYIGHFAHPPPPVFVFQFEDGIVLPMKVVGEIGYLLANPFEGVAYDPPRREMSTSMGV
jgi:hypothetical protein